MELLKIKYERGEENQTDGIIISISPKVVRTLRDDYYEKAIHSNIYDEQGLFREICNFFQSCLHQWYQERDRINAI